MNVLQLLPELNIGGVEKSTVEVARYLSLNGHKSVVVSEGGKLLRSLTAVGARHYTLLVGRKNPFWVIKSYFKLKSIIRKENIDIVHARSRVPALSGYFAARSTGRVFLTTAHGQYRRHLISRVMGWGKLVITASLLMARHMNENFGVPLKKIRIVPRGVDLDEFSFIAPEERKGPIFKVGMICRFTPLKGHLDFLKAASLVTRRMPNCQFVLMGNVATASEEYMRKIHLAIRNYSMEKDVAFVESDEDVAEVMAGLNILVSANRAQEAFGRTVIEAQARGTCVVATDIGGVAENVDNGSTGLLCRAGDAQDMADKILALACDKDLAGRIAKAARKKVETDFSLDKVMGKTLEVYEEALKLKRILVIKLSSLGDVVLAVPSLRAIRKSCRNARITLLTDVRYRELFTGSEHVDEVISTDLKGRDKGFGLFRLARRIREEDFDISIDLQNNRKSHLISFLSGIPERYGYDNGKLGSLLNHKIPLPRTEMGPVEHQGQVLNLAGITGLEKRLELFRSEEASFWADEFLKRNWVEEDRPLVGINISASAKWTSKNWPEGHLARLAKRLEKDLSARVLLLGTEGDREIASRIKKKGRISAVDSVGKTDLGQLVELIFRCDALVTADSAPLHIAAACGTPAVALFGPTDPARHMPPGKGVSVLRGGGSCTACYKAQCPKDNRCMRSISVKDVYAAVEKALKSGEVQ